MQNKKLEVRSDFADEWILNHKDEKNFQHYTMMQNEIMLHFIKILSNQNCLNKEKGTYITIEFENMDDRTQRMNIISSLQFCLHEILEEMNLQPNRILVVGLGNDQVVSDALGPNVVDDIMVTAHLYRMKEFNMKGTRDVACIVPGVMGQTGLESSTIVKSIVSSYQPDLIMIVDALATGSTKRINQVIQLNNVGITPGSGVGNHRMKLDQKTLGVPVISLGVATVISVAAILKEFVPDFSVEHLEEASPYFHLVVTPKSIDSQMKQLTEILSLALNRFIHPDFDSL